jgi:hypothetical protein
MREVIHMQPRADWLPAHALAGSIWLGPLGESVRVELDGSLTDIRAGTCGWPETILITSGPFGDENDCTT